MFLSVVVLWSNSKLVSVGSVSTGHEPHHTQYSPFKSRLSLVMINLAVLPTVPEVSLKSPETPGHVPPSQPSALTAVGVNIKAIIKIKTRQFAIFIA